MFDDLSDIEDEINFYNSKYLHLQQCRDVFLQESCDRLYNEKVEKHAYKHIVHLTRMLDKDIMIVSRRAETLVSQYYEILKHTQE